MEFRDGQNLSCEKMLVIHDMSKAQSGLIYKLFLLMGIAPISSYLKIKIQKDIFAKFFIS